MARHAPPRAARHHVQTRITRPAAVNPPAARLPCNLLPPAPAQIAPPASSSPASSRPQKARLSSDCRAGSSASRNENPTSLPSAAAPEILPMSAAPALPPAPIFQSPISPHQNAAHSRNEAPATSALATAPAAAAPPPWPSSPTLSARPNPQTMPSLPGPFLTRVQTRTTAHQNHHSLGCLMEVDGSGRPRVDN